MPNATPTLTYPTQTIFHWLPIGLILGIIGSRWALLARVGSTRLFRYQHVGIGRSPTRGICPYACGFLFQWNVHYRQCESLVLGVLPNAKPQRKAPTQMGE